MKFMNKCLLLAIKDMITSLENQSWDFNYMLSQAKSNSIDLKRIQHKHDKENMK